MGTPWYLKSKHFFFIFYENGVCNIHSKSLLIAQGRVRKCQGCGNKVFGIEEGREYCFLHFKARVMFLMLQGEIKFDHYSRNHLIGLLSG